MNLKLPVLKEELLELVDKWYEIRKAKEAEEKAQEKEFVGTGVEKNEHPPQIFTQSIRPGIKIIILQRGWVIIGNFSQDGDICHVSSGYVIRRWGTTSGLGQIAKDGPTSETQLDAINGLATFHILTTIFMIDCQEDKWKDYIK